MTSFLSILAGANMRPVWFPTDEEKYIHRHPGPHFSALRLVALKEDQDLGRRYDLDRSPDELADRIAFLGAGGLNHWKKVRAQSKRIWCRSD